MKPASPLPTITFDTPQAWDEWLDANHQTDRLTKDATGDQPTGLDWVFGNSRDEDWIGATS